MAQTVLFISSPEKNLRKAGCLNDYLGDVVFYGLREILEDNVKCSNRIVTLYKPLKPNVPVSHIWGKGFTTCWLFDELHAPETDIEKKIRAQAYDFIIYGNIWICDDYYEIVRASYPPERVAILDGLDQPTLHPVSVHHPYFKRELRLDNVAANVHPISFAIPTSKVTPLTYRIQKTKRIATCVPGIPQTYVFDNEESYFTDYKESLFAITMPKHGWDCMRHYEIIANRCLPLFFDLQSCPKNTMTTFPKALCAEAWDLYQRFDSQRFIHLERRFMNHLLCWNTSRATASRLLDTLTSGLNE